MENPVGDALGCAALNCQINSAESINDEYKIRRIGFEGGYAISRKKEGMRK